MGCGSVVRAAGCVLWRRSAVGRIELALVYRPKWDDWSWPKGKLKRGETAREAALREVREETGYTCRLGKELPSARYSDAQGKPKQVSYWAAQATGGAFEPNEEVSDLVWLTPDEARERLTHERDRALITVALMAVGADEEEREPR
ncbi:DNA mismatch repair protein MutT [Streptomyces dysideae]|uniref:DNA mismatch repair protein MutT n=2 Tax=Streptomyces dysideae TaxID=909626 RepID=A0A124IF87_9ACTN|nr:DNA mismatch repair protein MutT [Streptomyces dysideae]